MSNLELKDGTPYNIVQVNGRWYFADGLFSLEGAPNSANSVPNELRLVPQNMIPATGVSRGSKVYSYVPESKIKEYFTSEKYRRAVEDTGNARVPASALLTLTTTRISNNIATVDEKKRTNAWNNTTRVPTTVNNATVDPRWQLSVGFDWGSIYGKESLPEATPWSYLSVANAKDSLFAFGAGDPNSNVVEKQGVPWLLLAGDDGKLTDGQREVDFRGALTANTAEKTKEYQQMLKTAGYLASDYVPTGFADTDYLNAMLTAAREVSFRNLSVYNAGQGKEPGVDLTTVNPWDLDSFLKDKAEGSASGNNRFSTSTSTSVFQLSEGEARSVLENFYAEAVGRRPSDKEVKAFKVAVDREAAKKPTTNTSRTTYDLEGNARTSSSSKGGFAQADAELLGRGQAEADPRANAFLTSTKYFDAFVGALRGPLG
jgi:hypothetical protein